ncbi:MAG: SgcJ/EcaC family oxidoreductase [Nitrospirales bacterium]
MLDFLVTTSTAVAQDDPRNQSADEAAVIAVTSGFVDAWNRHDMKAFAELFAEDADFVNVIGLWWRGRREIQKEHEALHASRMKNSHLTAVETTVRFLRPDVAVVHVRWELAGDTGLEGKPLPPRKGILTHVDAKIGGKWWITSSQNTDIVPLPNVPGTK